MHEVLQDFPHKFVLVYVDDILVYSWSMAKHRQHVAEVLQCLTEYNLFLKAEKYSFHQSLLQFLGYHISKSGIQMDEGKVDAIHNWPTPTTIKEIQRSLGFINLYHRFINNFSSIVHPLTSLLKSRPKSLSWGAFTPHSSRNLVLGTSQQGGSSEPISHLGHFPGCIRTGSRNSEAADCDIFICGIYKRQQLLNGEHKRTQSCRQQVNAIIAVFHVRWVHIFTRLFKNAG